jgi:hypothetical protein
MRARQREFFRLRAPVVQGCASPLRASRLEVMDANLALLIYATNAPGPLHDAQNPPFMGLAPDKPRSAQAPLGPS